MSSDHDPLFEFHRWKANLRILGVTEVKTVPDVPLSHPFVKRPIGTIRRGLLDQIPFWGAHDLAHKLLDFKNYYNREQIHASLGGVTPNAKLRVPSVDASTSRVINGSLAAAAYISFPLRRNK